MKYTLVILAVIVLSLSLVSCEKMCTCKTYKDGVLTGEASEKMPEEYQTCSDMNVSAETENGVLREVLCN